jgi:uncharacterized protein (DUF1499 family)
MNTHQETMKHTFLPDSAFFAYLGPAGFALAVAAGFAEALAGFGSRWGWWQFTTGFAVLRWAAVAGVAAAVLSLIGGIAVKTVAHRTALVMAAFGILIGLVVAGIPWSWMHTAQQVPRIHDITTDTADPPRFSAVLAQRQDAVNPADYGGPVVAAQQRAAYPDIAPVLLPVPPATAFQGALRAANDLGWQIVAANAGERRIEATATTFWFGFKDDIVIRIIPAPGGSRVDVRSVSRVGVSDVGTNAERVRTYLHKLTRTAIIDNTYTRPL